MRCEQEMCPMWDGDGCPCAAFGLDPGDLPTDGTFTRTGPLTPKGRSDMADLNLTELRKVAEAATPGPWLRNPDDDCEVLAENYDPLFPDFPFEFVITDCNGQASISEEDFAHIIAFDPPTVLALIDRLEAAERTHRDLTSRIGFGDGITEPMADNDTIVEWFDQLGREAGEWRESQMWRDTCYQKGHSVLEDCHECDPSLRLEAAEADRDRQARAADALDRTCDELVESVVRLRAKVERVRTALANHPRCERHPDDDAITCGWKSAVLDVQAAMDGDPNE